MPNLTRIVNLVGEIYKRSGFKEPRQPGKRDFSDLYVCQMVVVQNLKGYANNESAFLRYLKNHKSKTFPKVPSQSQYNRRVKTLDHLIEQLTPVVFRRLKVLKTKIRIIDATQAPVVKFYRRWTTKAFTDREFCGIGHCQAKDERYYGPKLTLIITRHGIPVNHHLMPGNHHDIRALEPATKSLLNVWLIGDKGYIGARHHQRLKQKQGIRMIVPKRKNQKTRNTHWEKRKLRHRRLVEVVNEQLKDQFLLEHLKAKSLEGIRTRIRNIIFSFQIAALFNKIHHRNLLSIKEILG